MNHMKIRKASGPSGVAIELFKAVGDPLNPNSYRGIKLLEQAFKLYKVLDKHLHELVNIDKMYYGFMPGKGTVDAVFVPRRLSETINSETKNRLFFIFVDLGKAFYWVPKEVIYFAFRQKGVSEYLVNEVISLYKGCKTTFLVDGELLSSFSVKVGVHQGSALNPFLFIMAMDILTKDVRDGSLMELLYADNLVLCRKSLNEAVCS